VRNSEQMVSDHLIVTIRNALAALTWSVAVNVNESANRCSADQGLSRVHVPVSFSSDGIRRTLTEVRLLSQVIKRRRQSLMICCILGHQIT